MTSREELIQKVKAIRDDAYLSATYLADEHVGDLMGDILAVFEQAHTPADDERDGVAKAMCAIETRSKAASLEEVQAGIQRWMRHRYEAERLIEELADAGATNRENGSHDFEEVIVSPYVVRCAVCGKPRYPHHAPDRENGSRDA